MLSDLRLLFFYLIHLQEEAGKGQAALLVKITDNVQFTFRFLAFNGGRPHETAGANILCQDMSTAQTKNTLLLLTSPPTEWEIGLQWARFVPELCYLDDSKKIWKIVRQENPSPGGYTRTLVADLGPMPKDLRSWYVSAVSDEAKSKKYDAVKMWKSFESHAQEKKGSILTEDPLSHTKTPFLDGIPVMTANCNSPIFRDGMFMKLAFALVGSSWSLGKKSLESSGRGGDLIQGNNIGAVLVDANSRILAWSVNIAQDNPTLHAECSLIRTLLNQNGHVPKACRLYTTLEPCHMCASLLATYCEDWIVLFGQKDSSISNNALERKVGTARQEQVLETSARVVENAWTEYAKLAPKRPNTLDFLRDGMTRKAFISLQLIPAQLQQTFFNMGPLAHPQHIQRRAASNNIVGRLGLDLPGGAVVNRPARSAPIVRSDSARGRLNLDVASKLTPLPPALQYTTGGFAREFALTTECVELMANLLNRGLIKFAD